MSFRLLAAFLVASSAILLQFYLGYITGVWVSFALAILITLSFFLGFWELVLAAVFVVFVLNWQPAFSLEILLVAFFPFFAFWTHKFLPFKPLWGNLILIFFSVSAFYLILDARFMIGGFKIFLLDVFGSLISGAAAFRLLNYVSPDE